MQNVFPISNVNANGGILTISRRMCACLTVPPPMQVVFNTRGEREQILADAAKDMISVFEALLALLLEPGASSRAVTRYHWAQTD